MARTIEKIILGILVIGIFGISSFVIAGLDNQKTREVQQISLDEAKAIALSIREGTVTEAVLTKEKEAVIYEIGITNGNTETEIIIDPITGNILSTEEDVKEVMTQEERALTTDKTIEERMKEIALREVNGHIISIDTEKEEGRVLYEITINNGNDIAEVEIDAETGEILEVEWGDDDEDEDEE